jgi:hypothetical protein
MKKRQCILFVLGYVVFVTVAVSMERREFMESSKPVFSGVKLPYFEDLTFIGKVLLGQLFVPEEQEVFSVSHLPEEIQHEVFLLLRLYTNADTLQEAAQQINTLSMVNTTLYNKINDEVFFERMVQHLMHKFNAQRIQVLAELTMSLAKNDPYLRAAQLLVASIRKDEGRIKQLLIYLPEAAVVLENFDFFVDFLQAYGGASGEMFLALVNISGVALIASPEKLDLGLMFRAYGQAVGKAKGVSLDTPLSSDA